MCLAWESKKGCLDLPKGTTRSRRIQIRHCNTGYTRDQKALLITAISCELHQRGDPGLTVSMETQHKRVLGGRPRQKDFSRTRAGIFTLVSSNSSNIYVSYISLRYDPHCLYVYYSHQVLDIFKLFKNHKNITSVDIEL